MISNGLLLRWNIGLGGEVIPLGNMHINSLDNIVPIEEEDPQYRDDSGEALIGNAAKKFHAFELDSSGADGRVALVYLEGKKKPQIWFQDLSCEWHFIANTFTDYFRLLIMHLGVPHWQYAFTDIGLDPISRVIRNMDCYFDSFCLAMVSILVSRKIRN